MDNQNLPRRGLAFPAKRAMRFAFSALIFGASLIPAVLALRAEPPDVEKVQEMRKLAAWPNQWEGGPLAVDKNYAAFDRWFNDNMAYRSLMIRLKNEIDYRLFASSSRVYFGKDQEIYGRNLLDHELPAINLLFSNPKAVDNAHKNVVKFSEQLKASGITMIMVTPMQRQFFTPESLPFFAPHIPQPAGFMTLYSQLKKSPELHFVDTYGILQANRSKFQLFYKQDFHWTELSARAVSAEVVRTIAELEGSSLTWSRPSETFLMPKVGSDARFAALLSEPSLLEPTIKRTWKEVHVTQNMDAAATGFEFETDDVADPALLPSTCLYGNSFSDGMVYVGLNDHFRKITRLNRDYPVEKIPEKIKGRCKYLIIQLLDISPAWPMFAS